MFKTEKLNLEKIRTGLQQNHASFQISLTFQITKIQDDLAMEDKFMDALAKMTKKGIFSLSSEHKQGGEGASKVAPPKFLTNPIIKKEYRGKEKLIKDDSIIDDDENEEPDEAELKGGRLVMLN
ncbi:unnamed protein product [Lactuca saligna]|uniref:Uncharacterized protein n=1 Tax=Lactuca saligna TaxID=75948 RepID=A0AA35YMP9_LACSI|nr:unnamed protein product [Lactuca saligna]